MSGRMNAYCGGGKRNQKIKRIFEKNICKELQQHKRKRLQRSGLPILALVGGDVLGRYIYKKNQKQNKCRICFLEMQVLRGLAHDLKKKIWESE